MTKEEFIKEIQKLDIKVTDEILNYLEIYKEFLKEYNSHTNLTTIKEDNEIYLKHFYDSLTIVKSISMDKIENLLDIGTGAGFPGMVLKIFFPHIKVTLLDSNNKKTTFLQELAKKLDIDVEIINIRVEDYAKDNLNKFDIVTSRAVADLRVLAELSIPLVKVQGYFIPLKGKLEDELEGAKETLEILKGRIIKQITFSLYNDEGLRNILVVEKLEKTNKDILRTYDKILKKPLKKRNK